MKTIETLCGDHILKVAKRMVAIAKSTGDDVSCEFNEVTLTANAGTTAAEIVAYYDAESHARHERYVNSPEYTQQQEEWKRKQEEQDAALAAAMAEAPPMEFSDKATWDEGLVKNQDSYGNACYRFAERWARLMQKCLGDGQTVAECAKPAIHLADNEGITGFMYGCAVSILAAVWVHGDELRRWHNLDTQIGNEGEKANETGSVLNPAIVSISQTV